MQNSDIKNTLLSNKQINIMESIYHYNSTEKYAFTTFTSVLDIILISVKKKKTKIEKKIPLLSTDMTTYLVNQKNLYVLLTLSNSG